MARRGRANVNTGPQNNETTNYNNIVVDSEKRTSVDIEDHTHKQDTRSNAYWKMIHLAEAVDAWRVFPRLFIIVYLYLLVKVVVWFTEIPSPTMEQSGLISVIVGAGAAWFGLYTGSGRNKSVKVNSRNSE